MSESINATLRSKKIIRSRKPLREELLPSGVANLLYKLFTIVDKGEFPRSSGLI